LIKKQNEGSMSHLHTKNSHPLRQLKIRVAEIHLKGFMNLLVLFFFEKKSDTHSYHCFFKYKVRPTKFPQINHKIWHKTQQKNTAVSSLLDYCESLKIVLTVSNWNLKWTVKVYLCSNSKFEFTAVVCRGYGSYTVKLLLKAIFTNCSWIKDTIKHA
jgi:hypothetical protein